MLTLYCSWWHTIDFFKFICGLFQRMKSRLLFIRYSCCTHSLGDEDDCPLVNRFPNGFENILDWPKPFEFWNPPLEPNPFVLSFSFDFCPVRSFNIEPASLLFFWIDCRKKLLSQFFIARTKNFHHKNSLFYYKILIPKQFKNIIFENCI